MSVNECLNKLQVKLRYFPPEFASKPFDCKRVRISKGPDILVFANQTSHLGQRVGIDLHCALPSLEGVGGVHFIVQVSTFIEWELEFTAETQMCHAPSTRSNFVTPFETSAARSAQSFSHVPNMQSVAPTGQMVREMHRIYASIPMAYTLTGPQILFSRVVPWQFKVAQYTTKILAAYNKLNEVEQLLGFVARLKNGFCPNDIKLLQESLRILEVGLNTALQSSKSSTGELARRTNAFPNGTGWFVGNRLA